MSEGEGHLLVLLIDSSDQLWTQLRSSSDKQQSQDGRSLGKAQFAQQLLLFLNTYNMLQEGNQLAVFAVDTSDSHILFHNLKTSGNQISSLEDSAKSSAEQVLDGLIARTSAAQTQSNRHALPCWSAALSRALCLVRKHQGDALSSKADTPKPRILCISGSPDVPGQYIAVMNAIFSAQRHGVVIETCMLGNADSAFLQQAAHVTGGLYLRPSRPGALLQYLLAVFSSDTYTRGFLQMPTMTGVDFRASCFCHKKTIDIGFVCSVCLSIFCQKLPECSTCGTDFGAPAGTSGLTG